MIEQIRIEPLTGDHDRSGFVSGSEPLDRYFQTQASQDVKRRVSACFVAVSETDEIAGYYTLTATGISLDEFPPKIVKKLPRYPVVPAALLGRLAIARSYQGQGFGGVLLADALRRVARSEMGVFALLVDAKDDRAQGFYERFGFVRLPGEQRRLYVPIDSALRRVARQ